VDDFKLSYVAQAKRYKRLMNKIRRDVQQAQEGITENEVLFRMKAVEDLAVLLGNDATGLVMDWESQQRHEEEQERDSTTG